MMPLWMETWLQGLMRFFTTGDEVMWALLVLAILLWFGLGYRLAVLLPPSRQQLRQRLQGLMAQPPKASTNRASKPLLTALAVWRQRPRHLRAQLDQAFARWEAETQHYHRVIGAIVIAAPLTGLLGTVVGMVDTFDAIAASEAISYGSGIAAGISKALLATQIGLAVAIPGLIINSLLERKAQKIRGEIEQVKDYLCATQPTEFAAC